MHNILSDFRYAFRSLRKDRKFTVVAVFALALGIGASTVVFSVFYNLLFNAFSAKDANRLVVPVIQDSAISGPYSLSVTWPDLEAIRAQNHAFEDIVGYVTQGGDVLANDGPRMYQFFCTRVTPNAFNFYGVPPLAGRGILPSDGDPGAPPVFVVSNKTWRATFQQDLGVLGKTFTVDGEPRTLVGVMPEYFQAYGTQTEIWVPINRASDAARPFADFPSDLLARLKRGVTLQAASADLDVIVKQLAILHPRDFPKSFVVRVEPAADFLLQAPKGWGGLGSGLKPLLYLLLAAVTMLLLIACSNVANLLLARATTREKEMAVRSALGATRGQLVRQLFVESAVLAGLACSIGCLLAWMATKFLPLIVPRTGDIAAGGQIGGETGLGINAPVLLFSLALAAVTTLICGMAPGLHALKVDLQPQLTGSGRSAYSAFRHGRLRGALVVTEVALSILLLLGTGLMIRSFLKLTHVELGFNPKNVLLVVFLPPPSHNRTPPTQRFASGEGRATLLNVVERLKALPGVTRVSIEDALPGYSPGAGPQMSLPGATRSEEAGLLACDENFLPMLEMHLTRGRWLSETEVQTAQYAGVINQRLARDLFGEANPIGQQVQVKSFKSAMAPPRDANFQIVGVVADIKNAGPQKPAMPMLFLPYTVRGGFSLLLKTSVEPASLVHAVREQIWAVDRNEIVGLSSPLDDFLQRFSYATPEFGLAVATPLASISLVLVVIGVFSVMAYTVSLLTQEIGVRMALGAQQAQILRMVLRKGFVLLMAGCGLGLAASFGLTRFLASQIWGVSPTDPWTFGGVLVLLLGVGLAACYLPARRAASVDPLVALRYE